MLDGIPRRFQQQAVLRVDRDGLTLGHPEEVAVEAPDVVEERPHRVTERPGTPGSGS